MSKIINASNIPLNQKSGTVPDVSGALKNYFQLMTFVPVIKMVEGFQLVETPKPIDFWGTIQPFSARQLMLKPEGERAWSWFTVHAEPGVELNVDDVITYLGVQYRVKAQTSYRLYGYVEFQLIEDWVNSGP